MVPAEAEAVNAEGWDTVAVADEVHPPVPVTVTVYDPAVSPEIEDEVDPLLQRYVKGDDPVAETLAAPSAPPLQETSVGLALAETLQGCGMVIEQGVPKVRSVPVLKFETVVAVLI